MPAFKQLPTPAAQTATGANANADLNALLDAQLTAASETAPVGGSYAEVIVSISNSGSADAWLAHPSDIPETPETVPVSNQVIPAGTAKKDALLFGPYAYGSLPTLRLIDGASCVVTFHFGRA